MLGDVLTVASDKHFFVGLEEQLDAFPSIGDQAGGGARRLEHSRRRREADVRHAVAGNVENREWRAVECVVLAREDVAEVAHV